MQIILTDALADQISKALAVAISLALMSKSPQVHQQMLDAANALDDAILAAQDETAD
jgi:hypothetical protein